MTFTAKEKQLLMGSQLQGFTPEEIEMFFTQCERTELDPFNRQIYAVGRWDAKKQRNVMSVQVSIDGFRLIAERSNHYAGQCGPFWCGKDGQWRDVWLENELPAAAKIGVMRDDFNEPCWGVARFEAYAQKGKNGQPSFMWQKMADVMIAKCAEALALRKAFPHELSGLYTNDEMAQASNKPEPTKGMPASKDPGWKGPLSKTDLKEKGRNLSNEINHIKIEGDLGQLDQYLAADDVKAIINQIRVDLPDWWDHEDGGLGSFIDEARQALQNA